MNPAGFWMAWEPGLFTLIGKMAGYPTLLGYDMQNAMDAIGDVLVAYARANMHWQNPTGALEASIQKYPSSYDVQVGSDLVYARRRELGFSGMTDSWGRYYANDPGAFYLTRALIDAEGDCMAILMAGLMQSLAETVA